MNIVRGTTPTITVNFSDIDIADIIIAKLTIKQGNHVIITKNLSDAEIYDNNMAFTLSQNDTLSLELGDIEIMLNWLTNANIRGVSKIYRCQVLSNHIQGVLNNE